MHKLQDVIDRKLLDSRRIFFSEPVTEKSAAEAIKSFGIWNSPILGSQLYLSLIALEGLLMLGLLFGTKLK